jgi:putative monooxygenase
MRRVTMNAYLPPSLIGASLLALLCGSASAATFEILGGAGKATLLLNESSGSKEAALSVLTLSPGAEVPEHQHEKSAELLYVMEGELELTVAGRAEKLRAGQAARVPAATLHSARVIGKGAAKLVQVYVGPGPEQRFKAGRQVVEN